MYNQNNYYYHHHQNQRQQQDIESQKQNTQGSNTEKDKGGTQTTQKDDEEHKKNKQTFFSRLCSIFKPAEINYDGEWMEEEIVRLINQKKQNNKQIKKFIQNMCDNNKYLFEKTCEFTEKLNASCEKYFYSKDQQDFIKKKFSTSTTKRFKYDKEMTSDEYEIFMREKNNTQHDESDNLQNTSKNQSNIKGITKQFSGQESNTHSAIHKRQGRFPSNAEQNKSKFGEVDLERQDSKKENKQDQDDFSLDFSGSAQNQLSNQQSQQNDNESGEDEDEEEDDDYNQEEFRQEKQKGDDDEDMNFSEEDENNSDEEDEDDEDQDESADEDNQGKGQMWDKIVNKDKNDKKVKEFNSELLKGSSLANQKLRQSKSLRYQATLSAGALFFCEIIQDKVIRIRMKDNYQKNVISFSILDQNQDTYIPEILNRLTTNLYNSVFFQSIIYTEPVSLFFLIPQSFILLEIILCLKQCKCNQGYNIWQQIFRAWSTTTISQQINNISIINQLIYENKKSEFDVKNENDEIKIEMIRKLNLEIKHMSFDKRAIALLKFYEDEGEDIKNQLKIVRQDAELEYYRQQTYNIAGKTIQGAQYQEYLKKQQQKARESKDHFKKCFGRYVYHREEDLFYLVYHLFNKQMYYHSDCLDELNKFDKWILVNQGDLEKIKEKKNKKDENAPIQEREDDQMTKILQEVDKYFNLVQNFKSQGNDSLPTRSREIKGFQKKKGKRGRTDSQNVQN